MLNRKHKKCSAEMPERRREGADEKGGKEKKEWERGRKKKVLLTRLDGL